MITRTIKSTTVNAMVVNTATAEVITKPVVLNGTFKSFEKGGDAFKYINELNIWKPSEVVVKLDFVEITEELWGMSEEEFMAHGHKLPPRAKGEKPEDVEK